MKIRKLNFRLMFVAAAFLAVSVQAQDLKISLNKKGKVGFVDSQGNVVVKYPSSG